MKTRYLLIAAAITLLAGIWQLAANARQTSNIKKQIMAADLAGQDTTALLQELKNHASTHMAAGTKVELEYSLQRAMTAAQAAAQPNGQIYAQAQQACGTKSDSVTQSKCVSDYVSKNLKPAATPTMPAKENYSYEFKSPTWTPDAAGALMLGAAGLFSLAVFAMLNRGHKHYM